MDDKDFNREMRKINTKMQEDKLVRMERIRKHQRQQILEEEMNIKEKNYKKKKDKEIRDCYLRKQAVKRNEMKGTTYKLIEKFAKCDTHNDSERKLLMERMKEWNEIGRAHV